MAARRLQSVESGSSDDKPVDRVPDLDEPGSGGPPKDRSPTGAPIGEDAIAGLRSSKASETAFGGVDLTRTTHAALAVWPLIRDGRSLFRERVGSVLGIAQSMARTLTTRLQPRDREALHRRLHPGFAVWSAFVDAANASIQFRRFDEADAVLTRGLGAFGGEATLMRTFAASAHDKGDFEAAIERWEAAMRAAPDDPFCPCALSANLRASHQIWQAAAVMTEALRRFPTSLEVITEAARTAMARRSFQEALALWTAVAGHDSARPDWLRGRVDALAKLERLEEAETALREALKRFPHDSSLLALGDILVLMRRDRAKPSSIRTAEITITPADLVGEFESLGDNCEFGLLQRYCGIEPLGLFRFSGSQARNLQHAFATNLDEYGGDADLDIFATSYDKEYVCKSRRYEDFEYHTEVYEGQAVLATLRAREIRKVAYLKERVILDLRSGEKIFVRKGGPYQAAVDLHRTMRQIGPNTLLWVQGADDDHPAGVVEIVEDGLLRGYISGFPSYADAHAFQFKDWLTICAKALALVKGQEGRDVRYRLLENKIVQVDQSWQVEGKGVLRQVEQPCFLDHPVYALTLTADTQRADAVVARRLLAPVATRASAVFSVWVLVPDSFRGSFVDLYFINSPIGFIYRANLDKRNVWQRVWASTRMPRGQANPIAGLRVTGYENDTIYLATWRLEEGCVPNDWLLDDATIRPSFVEQG